MNGGREKGRRKEGRQKGQEGGDSCWGEALRDGGDEL